MILKTKRTHSENNFQNKKDGIELSEIIFERKIIHRKSIIGGKLYNTETAKALAGFRDTDGKGRILFQTEKGNYLSASLDGEWVVKPDGRNIHECAYYGIRPEPTKRAKEIIGQYDPDKYIEMFGEVEEA